MWQNFATPSLQYSLLKFSKWFKYGLKAQKLLQGDKLASMITQGAALGYELLPFQGVWSSLAKLDFLIRFIWYVPDIP
mgnify:CR=1 FL=1